MRDSLRVICARIWYNIVMFEPKYTITPKILSFLTEIAEIKAVVERSRVLPLNEAQLRRQAILRMAHTSTSIEGNRLAQFEVGKLIEGKTVRGPQKDIVEVENYYQALRLMDELSRSKHDLSKEEILKIHQQVINGLVEPKKVGAFRPASVYVLHDLGDGREQVLYKGPAAKKVPVMIDEILQWLKTSKALGIHPVIQAALFHVQFVTVHPFTDGNGRTVRLLTQLLLYRNNWDFRKIIVLEDYYNRDRLSYINHIHEVVGFNYKPGRDLTPWLEYFIEGFLIEARKVLEQIQSIGYGKVSKKSEQIFLDHDEIQIMDFLTTTGRITSEDVSDILKVAKRTAQLKLKKLVDKGLLLRQGSTTATFYTLDR